MTSIGIHGDTIKISTVDRPTGNGSNDPLGRLPYVEVHIVAMDKHANTTCCLYPRDPAQMRQWAATILAAAEDLEEALEAKAISDAKKRERDERKAQVAP